MLEEFFFGKTQRVNMSFKNLPFENCRKDSFFAVKNEILVSPADKSK